MAKELAAALMPELRKLAAKHRRSSEEVVLDAIRDAVAAEFARRWPAYDAARLAAGVVGESANGGCRIEFEAAAAFILGEGPFPAA